VTKCDNGNTKKEEERNNSSTVTNSQQQSSSSFATKAYELFLKGNSPHARI
jgi:hypothetical protein